MAKHDPDLSRVFQALADPTRRAMLAALSQGAQPLGALAAPSGLSLPTMLRHLDVLETAGLVRSRKEGRQRLCAAQPAALAAALDYLAAQRAAWEAQLDRLQLYVETLAKEAPHGDPDDPSA
jgi:DNA-binding transcriptional ArsR family regulator